MGDIISCLTCLFPLSISISSPYARLSMLNFLTNSFQLAACETTIKWWILTNDWIGDKNLLRRKTPDATNLIRPILNRLVLVPGPSQFFFFRIFCPHLFSFKIYKLLLLPIRFRPIKIKFMTSMNSTNFLKSFSTPTIMNLGAKRFHQIVCLWWKIEEITHN